LESTANKVASKQKLGRERERERERTFQVCLEFLDNVFFSKASLDRCKVNTFLDSLVLEETIAILVHRRNTTSSSSTTTTFYLNYVIKAYLPRCIEAIVPQ
jgi:hypothetical protein